jgi:hypothetical protein
MHIEKIEFSGFNSPPSDDISAGAVTFVTDGTRLQIPLTMPRRIEMGKSRDRLLVLAEALKTARLLPEYRKKGELRFAPGVLPQELRRKA